MHPMLNIAIQAARSAGNIIVRFLDRMDSINVDSKSRHDYVTQVDHLAEEEIIQTIRKAYPSHSILAEESGQTAGDERFCWIIDPLDGTTNFIHGFPQFAVSIALKIEEKLEIGVVYDPLRQELFTATRGKGAQLNNRRIRVSDCLKLDHALLGTGFPFKEGQAVQFYLKTFAELFPLCNGVRRAGAASLDLAYVACGRLDGFWELALKPWDIAAGALLITEAGGMISDFQGTNNYFEHGNVISANPKLHPLLCSAIQTATRE